MKHSTLFLKIAVFLVGIPILALGIYLVPKIGDFAAQLYPNFHYIKYLVIIDLYATAIPFCFALYQAIKLLIYIDKNKAFSELSVKALNNIRNCAVIFGGLYVIGLPLFYLIAERDDAPGIIVIGLVIIFAAAVVAFFAAVLKKLLKDAIDIKADNDLTI